jgi:hypothetical protein
VLCLAAAALEAQSPQNVEGFGEIVFAHNRDHVTQPLDFRGPAAGYATAAWWAPGQMRDNRLVWKTAVCPERRATLFAFVGASSVTPPEFSRGPRARLFVNDHPALTFELGQTRDRVWQEGPYQLRYTAKRSEWPYLGPHRQFEMNGNSGIYELSVPAADIAAGKAVTLKVEPLPFPAWPNAWFMVKERGDTWNTGEQNLAEQVRQLQRDVARLTELTHVLAVRQYGKLLETRDFEHSVIYSDGYRHLHPADLIPLRNGELLVTAREGTEHIAVDGDVIMLRSRDGGRTWGEKQVIAGLPDLDEREGCGVQLRDGTILVGIFYNGLYRPDGSYEWSWERDKQLGQGRQRLGTYVITSRDNGHVWSKPNFISPAGMPFSDMEGPADAPLEMPDGGVLMPVMAYNVRGDLRNEAAVLLRSGDAGKTWTYYSSIAEDPGGKLGHFQEPALVRTRAGRLIAAMRNTSPPLAIWTTWSDDDGRTWKPARPSPMIGHPADLIELADGRILCTYGVRSPEHADPGGIRATFSHDRGETWDIGQEVQIRKDFLNHDIGYPESLQLPDGRILTVYYFNLFGRYFLGQTFWKP